MQLRLPRQHADRTWSEEPEQSRPVAAFLQDAQDWGEIWDAIGPSGHTEAEINQHESLNGLAKDGGSVYGARVKRKFKFRAQADVMTMDVAILAAVKGTPSVVLVDRDQAIIPRVPK